MDTPQSIFPQCTNFSMYVSGSRHDDMPLLDVLMDTSSSHVTSAHSRAGLETWIVCVPIKSVQVLPTQRQHA